MPGGRRLRPRGRPYTFACRVCRIVLADGVDYTWCPRCNHEVDWIDGRFPVAACPPCDLLINQRPASTDDSCPNCARSLVAISRPLPVDARSSPRSPLWSMVRGTGIALLVVQAVFGILDPDAFGYLAPLLVFAQLFAFLIVGWFLLNSNELRDLASYHQTRVIHGLEHATAKVLEERGLVIQRGLTTHGMFTLEVDHDGTHYELFESTVREAATDAISRIRFGEHALAYDRRCGTSLLVGVALLATSIAGVGLAAVILGWPVGYTFACSVAAGFASRVLSRRAGLAAQRWLTVSTDFASAIVTRVDKRVSADGSTLTAIVMIDIIPKIRDVDAVAPVPM